MLPRVKSNMDWTTLGWAGITLEIPADWELSGLSGDDKNGYLRMDDAEMPRLELKWSQSKQKKPDLHRVLDEYFKLIRKNFKRKDTPFHVQRNAALIKDDQFLKERDAVFFSWKGDVRANGVIFHCHTCKRITIVQMIGGIKENLREKTARILQSVQDHPIGQTTLWSAYQLHVQVPRRYRLEKHQLLSGYLLFSFVDGSRKVSVERYGLADVALKEHDLESWFRAKYAKAIRGYGFSIEPPPLRFASPPAGGGGDVDVAGEGTDVDERLVLVGEGTRLTDHIPFAPVLVIDKVLRRKTFAVHLWRCHHSNRIYVIQSVAKRDAVKTAEGIAASIRCHQAY